MSNSSSGDVDPTGHTEFPVTGNAPTAIPGSGSDSAGGPEIPGTAGVPHFPEMEGPDEDGVVAAAMLGTAVAFGVAAAAAAAPAVAAGAAAAGAAAAFIALVEPPRMLAEDEPDRSDEGDGS